MSVLLWALQTVDMILFSGTSFGQSISVVEINCCAYSHIQQNSKPDCRNKQQDCNLSLASTFWEGSDIISYLRFLGCSFLEGKIFSLWLCSSQKCLITVVPALRHWWNLSSLSQSCLSTGYSSFTLWDFSRNTIGKIILFQLKTEKRRKPDMFSKANHSGSGRNCFLNNISPCSQLWAVPEFFRELF